MRQRKVDRHLPPCVYQKHGAYWLVRAGKWHRLGTDLSLSLAEYGRRISAPKGGMADLIEEAAIDLVDDAQVSRQQHLEEIDGPFFQGFRQQRVVGVSKRFPGDVPSHLPLQLMPIHQQTHELSNSNRWMGVIQLYGKCFVEVV